MDETKSFLTSKTLWGLLITLVAPLLAQHGITFDQAGLTNDLIGLAGFGLAVYGRFQAGGLHVVAPSP